MPKDERIRTPSVVGRRGAAANVQRHEPNRKEVATGGSLGGNPVKGSGFSVIYIYYILDVVDLLGSTSSICVYIN